MKRIICFLICLLMLFSFVGCDSDTTPVLSGSYYAVGDYEEMLTPYLWLDINENKFSLGAGISIQRKISKYDTKKIFLQSYLLDWNKDENIEALKAIFSKNKV